MVAFEKNVRREIFRGAFFFRRYAKAEDFNGESFCRQDQKYFYSTHKLIL
jgi:hypothetical protein